MATEICLKINDDGTMEVSQEEVTAEVTDEMTGATEETGESAGTPVRDIKEALSMIQQMAEAASMGAPGVQAEESAMNQGFTGQ